MTDVFQPVPKPDAVVEAQAPVVVNQNVDTDAIEAVVGAIPEVVKETREGWKTTEFWLAIVTILLTVLDVIPLPASAEGYVAAAVAVAYALARGIAKQGVPNVVVGEKAAE